VCSSDLSNGLTCLVCVHVFVTYLPSTIMFQVLLSHIVLWL